VDLPLQKSPAVTAPPAAFWCQIPHATQVPTGYTLDRRAILSLSPGELVYWTQYIDSGGQTSPMALVGAPQINVIISVGGPTASKSTASPSATTSASGAQPAVGGSGGDQTVTLADGSQATGSFQGSNQYIVQWTPPSAQNGAPLVSGAQASTSPTSAPAVSEVDVNVKNAPSSLAVTVANDVSQSPTG
jgi:hypothetical protein